RRRRHQLRPPGVRATTEGVPMPARRLLALALAAPLAGLALAQPKPDLPVINPATAKLLRTVEGLGSPGTSLALAEGGKWVVAGCEDGGLRLWAREEGKGLLEGAKMQT